jgi:hypothetical protein
MMRNWFIDNAVQAGLSNHPAVLLLRSNGIERTGKSLDERGR